MSVVNYRKKYLRGAMCKPMYTFQIYVPTTVTVQT